MPQGIAPPLEYLLECSQKSLYDLELAALNRSQQHLRAAKAEWEEAVSQREVAGVARWLIENRENLLDLVRQTINHASGDSFPGQAVA